MFADYCKLGFVLSELAVSGGGERKTEIVIQDTPGHRITGTFTFRCLINNIKNT